MLWLTIKLFQLNTLKLNPIIKKRKLEFFSTADPATGKVYCNKTKTYRNKKKLNS